MILTVFLNITLQNKLKTYMDKTYIFLYILCFKNIKIHQEIILKIYLFYIYIFVFLIKCVSILFCICHVCSETLIKLTIV